MRNKYYENIDISDLLKYLKEFDVITVRVILPYCGRVRIEYMDKQEIVDDTMLSDISTYKLVEELKIRSGVDTMVLGDDVDFEISYGQKTISDVGSATILVVKD